MKIPIKYIKKNSLVNIEFDPMAKQIKRQISLLKLYKNPL